MKKDYRILFICKDNPFGLGGGNFATHAYLRAFSELSKGNIDVFLADGIQVDSSISVRNYFFTPPRTWISRFLSFLTGDLHRYTKSVLHRLEGSDANYDLCVFNNSKTSTRLIKVIKKKGIRIATIHHNVEPEYVRDNTNNPILRFALLYYVSKAERVSYQLSDYNFYLTHQDKDAFHVRYGLNKSIESVIGAFEFSSLPQWTPKPIDSNRLTFAITGSLCTLQGIDGIDYFFKKLYKYLPKKSQLIISGRNPSQSVIDYCDKYDNVKLVPNPVNINEIINQADIYICPTRLGGGLKLRVMDGLRLGIPVISHSCSARGYDVFIRDGILSVFDDDFEFELALSSQMTKLIDGTLNRNLVREKYEHFFSYEAGFKRIESIFQEE